jgi:hypothetical protein
MSAHGWQLLALAALAALYWIARTRVRNWWRSL